MPPDGYVAESRAERDAAFAEFLAWMADAIRAFEQDQRREKAAWN